MKILLTNDDGIFAPGLRALHKELRNLGEVFVVAPAVEQSAAGHSVTLLAPLVVGQVFHEDNSLLGYSVEGRPADCVKLALCELVPFEPDVIVSGLNHGSNAGINVLYSGTVAAAVEGAFFRRTAFAFSLDSKEAKPGEFAHAAKEAVEVLQLVLATHPPTGSLYNVNIPNPSRWPIQGRQVLPQNVAVYKESFQKRTDPRGRTYFWLGNDYGCPEPHPETDEHALQRGFTTITPLHFNLTYHQELIRLQGKLA